MGMIYKRPAVSFCMMMITGILAAYLSDSVLIPAGMFVLILACLYVSTKNRIKEARRAQGFLVPAIMAVFFLLGSLEFLAVYNIQLRCFSEFDGLDVAVKGYVASEPEIKGEKVSYIIKVSDIRRGYRGDFTAKSGKILLTTLVKSGDVLLDYGSEITVEGVLSQPGGVRNPEGFDYRRHLAQKGVGASIFAYPYSIEPGEHKMGNFLVQAGIRIRDRIVFVISNSLPRQQAALLNGMLIGYREGLSDEVAEAFSNAGLTHIMAVSGANVAFLILPLSFLLKRLRIAKKAVNILIVAFLALFVFVTGFEPSVLRAVIMADVLLIGAVLYREPDVYASIAVSCIILLAASPCMLFHIGFQLSYGATLGIFMLNKNIKRMIACRLIRGKAAEVVAATLSAQLGVLPVTLIHFNKISVISIIPNIFAAPMLELITVLGMLMAILGQFSLFLSRLAGYLNCVFLSAVLYIVKWSSSMPFASVRTVTPSLALSAAYYITVWFMLWYKPLKGISLKPKHIAAALMAAAVVMLTFTLQPTRLEVVFLDVGQGDSAFIRTYKGKTVLLDGGGSTNPAIASKVGEMTVVPFLLDNGTADLDVIIATHPHSDHTQGLENVLRQIKAGALIVPSLDDETGFSGLFQAAGTMNVPITKCSAGDVIRLDDKTRMEVLSPENNCIADEKSLNNASLVIKLCYGHTTVLFTGDAEFEVEGKLVANGSEVGADVIKIGHHGSSTSTGGTFLKAVNPDAAIISVGRNDFGHPSQKVLDLLDENGVKYFRTDECGAVSLKSDGKTIKLRRTVR